jgi:hypothetical protein
MTHSCCAACRLRFATPAPSTCPRCGHLLVQRDSAAQAIGLRLFVDDEASLAALERAIAATRAGRPPSGA